MTCATPFYVLEYDLMCAIAMNSCSTWMNFNFLFFYVKGLTYAAAMNLYSCSTWMK